MTTKRPKNRYLNSLPGGDLVCKGLSDLGRNVLSEEALLLLVARPRLVDLGLDVRVPENASGPWEDLLYETIEARNPEEAHSAYNALIGKIVSFAEGMSLIKSSTQSGAPAEEAASNPEGTV